MNCVRDRRRLRLVSEDPPTVSFQYLLFMDSIGTSSNSPSMHSTSKDALASDEE